VLLFLRKQFRAAFYRKMPLKGETNSVHNMNTNGVLEH
jgi:hypothetical protein